MRHPGSPLSWRTLAVCALACAALTAQVHSAMAQSVSADPQLVLRPHCADTLSTCSSYKTLDATTLATGTLKVGDLVDLDIVLTIPSPQKISVVRSWLTYDSTILEARSVTPGSGLTSPFPGERTIVKSAGLVKVGGAVDREVTEPELTIARVTFRVLRADVPASISFSDYRADGGGSTAVVLEEDGKATSLLKGKPSSLALEFGLKPIVGGASSESTTPTAPAASSTTFTLLQVQGLAVTTKNTTVFIGWSPLRSSSLTGYYVYYGSVSGRYLQRHSVPPEAASLVLRDLPLGSQLFFAVRGVSAGGETTFGQEESVIVGRPETSTSPLVEGQIPQGEQAQGNPIETHGGMEVTGSTGLTNTVALLVLLSAGIGTLFSASRNRLTMSS